MLKLSWLISLGITLIGFLIIQQFFTIQPEGVSANGNLGLVGIVIVTPFLLLSLFTTYRFFLVRIKEGKDKVMKIITIFGGLFMIAVLFYLVIDYKNTVITSLETNIKIDKFSQMNEFTYDIFFNFYTYALVHTVSGVIGTIVGFIQSKIIKEELAK
ncbi:nucleoside-diphosphate sugar epimerase [Ureibacillus composti]|nr:nucleoside-diphosphate sugar epimerase [Ureibacillus composti]